MVIFCQKILKILMPQLHFTIFFNCFCLFFYCLPERCKRNFARCIICCCGANISLPVTYSYLFILPDNKADIFAAPLLMPYGNFSFLILSSMVMICGALRNLVPCAQFKKCEKHPWRSIIFCTNGTKSRKAPHILLYFFQQILQKRNRPSDKRVV